MMRLISLLIVLLMASSAMAQWGLYQRCGNTSCAMCYENTSLYMGNKVVVLEASPALPKDFQPTPMAIIDRALDYVGLGDDDALVDLGCGDGRWLVAAAKRGATATGIEIDEALVSAAKTKIKAAKVKATVIQGDLMDADLRDCTVVSLYLTPELMLKVVPKLGTLQRGSEIVSYQHPLPGIKADTVLMEREQGQLRHVIYYYKTPLKMTGDRWTGF